MVGARRTCIGSHVALHLPSRRGKRARGDHHPLGLPAAQRGPRARSRLCMTPAPGPREGSGTGWTELVAAWHPGVHRPQNSYILKPVHFLLCELHL